VCGRARVCRLLSACAHVDRLRSLVSRFRRHVQSLVDVVGALADAFLACCVVVVVAAVVDQLLLRTLRACAVLPVRRTYVMTSQQVRQLDGFVAGATVNTLPASAAAAAGGGTEACDGRAFTCRDALISCPVTDLLPPHFSETKV